MTDFCGIPLVSLRENSITELDLSDKGIGVPGAIVLSKLLPSAAALTSLRCAANPIPLACQTPLTSSSPCSRSLSYNAICGRYDERGSMKGTYTTDGITALCEGLKGSAVTSLT